MSLAGRRHRETDILVVCTGNICRSPYVAARLAAALPMLTVASAGTGALVGEPPQEMILELLRRHGVGDVDHSARQLRRADLRNAQLIITATRSHRARVAQLSRSAGGRAFTLLELARVIDGVELGLSGVIAAGRAAAELLDPRDHADDLADPYRQGPPAYESMAADADAALRGLIPALATSSGTGEACPR